MGVTSGTAFNDVPTYCMCCKPMWKLCFNANKNDRSTLDVKVISIGYKNSQDENKTSRNDHNSSDKTIFPATQVW